MLHAQVVESVIADTCLDVLRATGEFCTVTNAGSGRRRCRDLYMLPKFGSDLMFASCEDTIRNVRTAILERVFFHIVDNVPSRPFIPTPSYCAATLRPFKTAFKRFVVPLTPVPLEVYPKSVYRGQKLKLYQRAANIVKLRGVLRSDSYLNTFLKHEKLPVTSKRTVPRVIQPRSPVYNVEVGRYLHQLEAIVYSIIARIYGRPTVMKGYNASQVGHQFHQGWVQYCDPVAVGLDASRFDQHVSQPLLRWEHSLYKLFYPGDTHLAMLLEWQCVNKGFVHTWDGSLSYKVKGGRCSGDMNTAMGNCALMCAMVYSLLQDQGMVGREGTKVALFNNGDDCVLMGERGDITKLISVIPDYFTRLGFVMKVEPMVDCLERVSFCQTQPIYDGNAYVMCRDVHVSLSKDVVILDRTNATNYLRNHCSAIGECGLALTGGLPILQSYYGALRRSGAVNNPVYSDTLRATGFFKLSCGMKRVVGAVSNAARISFYNAFGIPPDVQVEAERYYDQVSLPVCKLAYGVVPPAPWWW